MHTVCWVLNVAHGSTNKFEGTWIRVSSPNVRKTPPAKQLRAARNQPSKMGSRSFKKNGINSPCRYHNANNVSMYINYTV